MVDADRAQLERGENALELLAKTYGYFENLDPELTPFQTLDWARSWLAAFQPAEVWVVAVSAPPRGILALALRRIAGVRVLTLVGDPISDYLGPLPSNIATSVTKLLAERLQEESRHFDAVDLRSLSTSPETRKELAGPFRGRCIERSYDVCPRIGTVDPWDEYLRQRTRKFRANWKRTVRRVESFGTLEAGPVQASPDLLEEMIDVERSSWKWEQGLSFLRESRTRNFLHHALLTSSLEHEVWCCRVNGELASFAVVFPKNGVRHYYLPSFRGSFPDTGTYLLGEIVRDSCSREFREVDLLQGDEAYKRPWTTTSDEVHELCASSGGIRGRSYLELTRLRWKLAQSDRLRRLHSRALSLRARLGR